jgi:hypothetical protein
MKLVGPALLYIKWGGGGLPVHNAVNLEYKHRVIISKLHVFLVSEYKTIHQLLL